MKKILFASTALVAFGLVGAAQAADPISLKLGGYSKWVAGYADNDVNGFEDVAIKGTNEVYFLGATTLDNGLKIGVQIELEAGGQNDQGNPAGAASDVIDESYITIDGGFGRVILGSENNGAYLLHVAAPDAAANFGESEIGINRGAWIVDGTGASSATWTTAINTDNDAHKITYVAPSFAGFTVGASYIPTIVEDTWNQQLDVNLTDLLGVAAAYNNSFSGVGVKLSAGYVFSMDDNDAFDSYNEWSLGGQAGFAGFTAGAGFKRMNVENAGGTDTGNDGYVWEAGIQYATGPFAVSFAYMASETAGSIFVTADDERDVYQVSAKYNMGPGVDAIATIGHADFEGEAAGIGDDNDGWAAMTGLALSF